MTNALSFVVYQQLDEQVEALEKDGTKKTPR